MSSASPHAMQASRKSRCLLVLLALAITGVTWAADLDSGGSSSDPLTSDGMNSTEEGKYVLREGTKVTELLGTFGISGDRAEFTSADGKLKLGGLENLALERIVQTAADNQSLSWSVSGTIMEFKGSNFILVTHAVVKSRGADREKSQSSLSPDSSLFDEEPLSQEASVDQP